MKKVAILQSNYIPWKGYFDLIAAVDEFILFDEMQYTRRDWRNRNQIKTPQGLQWLTVPVIVKGKYHQKIKDTEIDGSAWKIEHWKALNQNYARTKYFNEITSWLNPILFENEFKTISELNFCLIKNICAYLGINTEISNCWDYGVIEGKTERLVDLCLKANAKQYFSGPSAKNYIDESLFNSQGISLHWISYDNYEPYPQLWGEFMHNVSILDLLFNCGKNSVNFMNYAPKQTNL